MRRLRSPASRKAIVSCIPPAGGQELHMLVGQTVKGLFHSRPNQSHLIEPTGWSTSHVLSRPLQL